ncbi:DUF4190 domain-containing protein [Tsukamurella pseudospumae]|uniref:DUF4190 domain-containing protein n=1 Tax=Tsukamurella pseudospumae TaxID=239498 RepID=A0A137Z6S6_9ACTN|nr:DUF4190 domain-containing protein [Tsukamurella pseudospumae]KXO93868.1 hypothetical protein AXK61_04795 [Tsukamurella pseudospumae]
MTSNDPQQPGDGTYDPTVIRPAEPASSSPDLTKRDTASDVGGDPDAATTVHPTALPDPYTAPSNPYAPPADPYAVPNPYGAPADPYAAPSNPYAAPSADPYAAPPVYPGEPQFGQNAYGQQQFGQQPGFPAYPGQNLPGYPAPGYGQPTAGTNGLAIAAMVCGIVSIAMFCAWGIGIVPGIAAVVMGIIAMNKIKVTGQQGHGMALAGIITGGIGILVCLAILILIIIGINADTSSTGYVLGLLG